MSINIKELNQLIEGNTDLSPDEASSLYDLFLHENLDEFEQAHEKSNETGDAFDGVDLLVDHYWRWVNEQDVEEALADNFFNRTIYDMTENFVGALT